MHQQELQAELMILERNNKSSEKVKVIMIKDKDFKQQRWDKDKDGIFVTRSTKPTNDYCKDNWQNSIKHS